jgi:hypothetical protein
MREGLQERHWRLAKQFRMAEADVREAPLKRAKRMKGSVGPCPPRLKPGAKGRALKSACECVEKAARRLPCERNRTYKTHRTYVAETAAKTTVGVIHQANYLPNQRLR